MVAIKLPFQQIAGYFSRVLTLSWLWFERNHINGSSHRFFFDQRSSLNNGSSLINSFLKRQAVDLMRVCLLPFGPFQGRALNQSEVVAQSLDGTEHSSGNGRSVQFITLPTMPVLWSTTGQLVQYALEQTKQSGASMLLLIGEDMVGKPTGELSAANIRSGIDASNQQPDSPVIDPRAGPEATRHPVLLARGSRHLANALVSNIRSWSRRSNPQTMAFAGNSANIRISRDGYLCNFAAWNAYGSPVPSLFIHVPVTPNPQTRQNFVDMVHELARLL